jgi:CheY-like chemotaxis protein
MVEQKPKILVVDDEASVGQVLKAGLEMNGFTVRYEARSTDTIKTCLEFHPDLVLLDVDMPVKDGGQVASDLQRHPTLRHTQVIFLTSLLTKEEAAKRNASHEIILSKTNSIAELVTSICTVLEQRDR